jgi:hypothetical protein
MDSSAPAELECFYTETESYVVRKEFPPHLVSDEIGAFKLEHQVKEGLFIRPKDYYLETQQGKIITKLKGLSLRDSITKDDYLKLYKGEPVDLLDRRMTRNLNTGLQQVTRKQTIYPPTHDKREAVFDSEGH